LALAHRVAQTNYDFHVMRSSKVLGIPHM